MSFWDQFGKMVAPPAASGMSPTAQPAYVAQLEQSVSGVCDKISEMLYELGQAYYERHNEDHQTEFEEQLTAIRAAYAEIAQYRRLAAEVDARKRCPTCGAELMAGAAFCSSCGTRLP